MDGGGCLLALSKVLDCYGFESFEFKCASELNVSYVVLESQTVVVGDSYDFHLIGVRVGCIVLSDGCEIVMVVFLLLVCYESGCGFLRVTVKWLNIDQ